ncbi:MAG: aminoacyl-tRNA hydrolase, partial [Bacteroidetes bacterium]|nr:aminoacyl-tRNA hydrolase [Bacteroidota bacterium]
WQDASKMSCMMASGFVGTNKVVLIKPTTYMNLSGNAVSSVQNYYKIALSDIIVIHDDLDISCGSIKYKPRESVIALPPSLGNSEGLAM